MSRKLGDLVKKARTEKGLTQAALAEKVDGLTASDVSKIERGEKEPAQDVLKQMAKALGVTQKSLLDAAMGSGKTAAAKTTSSKTGTAAKKTSSSKTTSTVKDTIDTLKLTATEKKLVQLYRKADTKTKKAAINLLEGDSNAIELIGALLSAKGAGSSGSSGSSGTSDLLSALLSGKTGGSSGGAAGKDTINALMELLGKANK
ncbi:MAG: helix-turn-helix domain-containing protein [Lachnospiraceae bacterium]|nr:helix-turn-helix domain-containing protein [Lachnospiraceae bacterium]